MILVAIAFIVGYQLFSLNQQSWAISKFTDMGRSSRPGSIVALLDHLL